MLKNTTSKSGPTEMTQQLVMFDRPLIDGVSQDNHHHICCTLKLGTMNNWCKFGKDPLRTKGCMAHTKKNEFGPLVATNVTKW